MNARILDLFCCEGGAAVGYVRAGFQVFGVDLFKHKDSRGRTVGFSQNRYPYPSAQMDCLTALRDLLAGRPLFMSHPELGMGDLYLEDFDAIHASPPCQHASAGTRAMRAHGDDRHPALIEPTRELLIETGLPYVIENVEGAALRDPITLCGTMFGLSAIDDDGTPLEMWRHRLFESNVRGKTNAYGFEAFRAPSDCHHGLYAEQVAGSYGGARRDKVEARHERHGGYVPSIPVQQRLLGIDWMTQGGMFQSVPPAYTKWVGEQLLAHIRREVAA